LQRREGCPLKTTNKVVLLFCLFAGVYGYPGTVCAIPLLETFPAVDQSIEQPDLLSMSLAESRKPPTVNIPRELITMYLKSPGADSRFEMRFEDIPDGYDLVNNDFYPGWCADRSKRIHRNTTHIVKLYSSYDPDLPPEARRINWNRINYLLNHKEGKQSSIQRAIWHLTNGSRRLPKEVESLVRDAEEKGTDFIPGEGEVMAIICYSGIHKQMTFIEYGLPVVLSLAGAPPPIAELGAAPVIGPVAAAPSVPWPLAFGVIPPIIGPIFSGGGDGGGGGGDDGGNPKPPPAVPEPATLTLFVIGLAVLSILWLSIRRYRPRGVTH
jgi:hypothetical protein